MNHVVAANSTEQLRAGERDRYSCKERETREEAAGCGLIRRKSSGKRDSLLSIKEPHTLICQPAQICDESRRRFSLPDSNETQSSGTGVADRTRIAEGHAQFVRLWAAKHANDRPRHVRHHIQLRSGNDCRGAGRAAAYRCPADMCGIGQNAGHLRLRKAKGARLECKGVTPDASAFTNAGMQLAFQNGRRILEWVVLPNRV